MQKNTDSKEYTNNKWNVFINIHETIKKNTLALNNMLLFKHVLFFYMKKEEKYQIVQEIAQLKE